MKHVVTAKRPGIITHWFITSLVVDVLVERPKFVLRISQCWVEEGRLAEKVFVGHSALFGLLVDHGLVFLIYFETFFRVH